MIQIRGLHDDLKWLIAHGHLVTDVLQRRLFVRRFDRQDVRGLAGQYCLTAVSVIGGRDGDRVVAAIAATWRKDETAGAVTVVGKGSEVRQFKAGQRARRRQLQGVAILVGCLHADF